MLTYADECGGRDAVLACLDVCRGRVQRELMLKNLRAAVGMEAPVGREEALRWSNRSWPLITPTPLFSLVDRLL